MLSEGVEAKEALGNGSGKGHWKVEGGFVSGHLTDFPQDITAQIIDFLRSHPGQLLIGRGDEADIVLSGAADTVSKEHAILSFDGERFMIKDLGSTNGTFVDDDRLEPAVPQLLSSGSKVIFGKFRFSMKL
jgi:predicted component of type VI protein secretion system